MAGLRHHGQQPVRATAVLGGTAHMDRRRWRVRPARLLVWLPAARVARAIQD